MPSPFPGMDPYLTRGPIGPARLAGRLQSSLRRGPVPKRILYGEDPIEPPLEPEQAEWVKAILPSASVS